MIEKLFIFIFEVAEQGLRFTFEFLEVAWSAVPKKKEGYSATFIPQSSLLSSRDTGFCLTGKNNLSVKDSYQNALVVGGTGVGKSSVTLIPSAFTMLGSSKIFHDPSSEIYNKVSGFLAQNNYTIKVLNFSNPDVSCACGYNPLARANTQTEVQKVANLLVTTALGSNSKDPFWNSQATALLTMLIIIIKKQKIEFQNLYNVRQLLNSLGSNPKGVDALFAQHADDVLFSEYSSFVDMDDKTTSGVIATCKSALQIFADPAVARVTSFDTIDFKEFREKPVALFINNSVADQKYYSVLTSIFFEQFFSYVMSRFPAVSEKDIFFLIDEASSLKLPTLQLALSNVRKHRSGIMLIVQDVNQLSIQYGKDEATAIKAICFAKLYYTGASLETSRELEALLGKYEYTEKKKGTNNTETKVVRSLMTADEIRTMKVTNAILICGHHKPIMAKLEPYYTQRRFRGFDSIPPPVINNGISAESVSVLPLPKSETEQ